MKKINRTAAFKDKNRADGNVTVLNSPEHIEAINNMNKTLEIFRREYYEKDRKTKLAAQNIYLR